MLVTTHERTSVAECDSSSETQGFNGEGDGKESGSVKNEEEEGGGAGKGTICVSDWPHF